MVSELAANAIDHGDPPVTVTLELREYRRKHQKMVSCRVHDHTHKMDTAEEGSVERGRGLLIVFALATEAGVRRTLTGKTVWFRVEVPEAAL